MSEAYPVADTFDQKTQNHRVFMQLGFFGLLFLGLTLIADVSPAYGSCSGMAAITGPLLPVMA